MTLWKPSEKGEVPTLGYQVIDWITENLAAPDRAEYEPFILYPEQAYFLLRFYELDPNTCKRKFRRGVYSRPRGSGKSPFMAAIALAEALGPVVPAGWDADGQPVGMSWDNLRTPLVQVAAVSETQTKNTWSPLLEMCREGPILDNYPGLEPMDTFVNLPRGRIEPITSSARTVKGNRPVFVVLDQTEEWVSSNGGVKLASTLRINGAKIGGSTIESPNAYTPGEGSVAEASASYWQQIQEGRAKDEDGLFYDHREAPADTDLEEAESLRAGLEYAYGDSADVNGGHVDISVIMRTVWDPAIDPQTSRADFLNQITHASDSWVSMPEWGSRYAPDEFLRDRDMVTMGFDGSRGRKKGKADATALVATRVSDGFVSPLGIWEAPDGIGQKGWAVPEHEVDASVIMAFDRFNVVGFYADPTMWDEHVARWTSKFGPRLKVKAGVQAGPIRWPKNQMTKVSQTLEALHASILSGELSHDGNLALSRHVLNARNRKGSGGIYIAKEYPMSPKKIDAAYAMMLSWRARLDAIALGLDLPSKSFVPRRVR